jgi:hypothetical protein
MELMIPVWNHAPTPQIAMKRLQDLQGATVALVDDNFDEPFTTHVVKLLTEKYGAIVQRLIKPLGTAPSPKSLIDKAAQAQVAIVGIAL